MSVAVLIDIAGKQNYIFSSNRLKEIVGASRIIEKVTNKEFIKTEAKLNQIDGNFGGGNATLFFDDIKKAKEFIGTYSRFLLKNFPSLVVYFAVNENFDKENFKDSMAKSHQILDEIKNDFFPLSEPLALGIEELCPSSDFVTCDETDYLKNYRISKATCEKQSMAKDANKHFNDEVFKEILGKDYAFSSEIDEIVHDEKSFMAVGHIDANDLGSKVKNLKSMDDFKNFSDDVDKNMKEAIKNTIKILIENRDKFEFLDIKKIKYNYDDVETKKMILPFRPIVLSGDDFTFVSEGRFGVYIAKIFIEELKKLKVRVGKSDDTLFASGGVVIVKSKTPFFRAYELAEDLSKSAKKFARSNGAKTSLDFIIADSNILGDLDFLRNRYYSRGKTELFNGGYESLDELLSLMDELNEISRTKVMKLRDILMKSSQDAIRYLEIYCEGKLLENGKLRDENRLLEAIELSNFYPLVGGKYAK